MVAERETVPFFSAALEKLGQSPAMLFDDLHPFAT